ncbi:hypothetical protein HK096_002816 [Nowakowskiella sp. JEL0078]|nr:hypothetical protein HK096_002816 [Nowakowskiella sp. JEL0078]
MLSPELHTITRSQPDQHIFDSNSYLSSGRYSKLDTTLPSQYILDLYLKNSFFDLSAHFSPDYPSEDLLVDQCFHPQPETTLTFENQSPLISAGIDDIFSFPSDEPLEKMQTDFITDNINPWYSNNSNQQLRNNFLHQNNDHQQIQQTNLTHPLQFTIHPHEQLSTQTTLNPSNYTPFYNDYFSTPSVTHQPELFSPVRNSYNHTSYNSTPSELSFCSQPISEILSGSEYIESNEQVVFKVEEEVSREKTHPVRMNPFKCRFCSELFPIVTNLRSHVQKVHSDIFSRELAKCKKRASTLPATEELNGKPAKRSSKKGHACEHCQKSFLRKQDLKRHSITHIDGLKPYVCDVCQVTFTRSDALNRHVKSQRCASKV